ncbi:ENTH domain protein (macronuclear) [Tetrahymena thermophila SB210]|uniref:ENTH domain protein n=1 Tax=Tetrahymena thermophila (strain SB210) TaxID=312017 RepID=I7LX64_TETTS|nr:ENTH domain protein [Tetrahymena thermophila SB210]EAS03841.2 ENTH domain protein [Tetrahymena thermophila SB210]|eukprot:XP_001024086.2 ENTH domain protein [Tetrahymena thermophila SB210]
MDIIKRAAQELKDRVNKTSQIEKLLQEATSKDNWQAHPKTLNTIAEYTNSSEEWNIISKYIWEKLYKSDKSQIVTFKTLVLIEHLLKNGSPRCIMEFKDELYKIKKLQDFKFYEGGEDKGSGVRQRSKNIVDLLTDEDKLDHERQTAKELREKMNKVNYSSGAYEGMGSNTYGQSQGGGSKYAGFSSDTYKESKYQGFSSKDNVPAYKQGESYDTTEFKGLDKYRNKDKNENQATTKPVSGTLKTESNSTQKEEEQKKPFSTQLAPLPKPGEVKSVGQIKIAPPGQKPQQPTTTQPTQATQQQNLIEFDEPAPVPVPVNNQNNQNKDDDWDWGSATTAPKPVQNTVPPQQPAVSQQIYNQYPNYPQQQPQPQQQPTGFNLYQQPAYQPQQTFNPPPVQQQVYKPPVQQQNNDFDLFQSAPAVNNNNNKPQQNNNKQEVDLFGDFQGSQNQGQEQKNFTNDEFNLIDLGDMKKEAEKKQKEKEQKNQQSNEFGFSTLNTQLDSLHINQNTNLYNMSQAPPQQSNYAALNQINVGYGANQQGYGMQYGMQGGYGVPPQGYGMYPQNQMGMGYGTHPQGMGYGQPQHQGYGAQGYTNNFKM